MPPLARRDDLVIQETGDEVLVYDVRNDKAICLNTTSALVWNNCDGKMTVEEIGRVLAKQFNEPANENLTWLALDQLKKHDLIENEVTAPAALKGLSRREVLKRVGIGTLMALPVVMSLTAPMAIHAASACGATCTCSMQISMGAICAMTGTCAMSCNCIQDNNGNSMGTCFT